MGQWLRLHVPSAGGTGPILGWKAKIPHVTGHGQEKKRKNERCFSASHLGGSMSRLINLSGPQFPLLQNDGRARGRGVQYYSSYLF